jgi:hypothetical protein
MTEHTPGPWLAGTWGAQQEHAVIVIDQWNELVADTSDLIKDWAICEANARLIAAAPRMADYISLHAGIDPEARVILQEAGVLP